MYLSQKSRLFLLGCTLTNQSGTSAPRILVQVGLDPPNSRLEKTSVFEQVRSKLSDRQRTTLRVTQDGYQGAESQYWRVELSGVGAAAWSDTQDAGGLFRACTRDICMELQSTTLPLLVPSPNAALGVEGRDRWLPTPPLSGKLSDTAREQYKFLGAQMGAAARGATFMELDLAAAVWKKLLGETLTVDDLSSFDERIVQYLKNLVAMSEGEWDAADVRWRIRNAGGRIVALTPAKGDAASDVVPFTRRDDYIAAALALRLGEFDEPIAQMKAGLGEVVPVRNGMGLMGWRELEQRVCGEPRIDLEVLKSIAKYDGEYRRQGASHPVIAMFWRVMDGMTEQVCKLKSHIRQHSCA